MAVVFVAGQQGDAVPQGQQTLVDVGTLDHTLILAALHFLRAS